MDNDPWERHAGWWQVAFTDGADPEYEEQILPIVEQELSNASRVLDLGCGEGQVSRRCARAGRSVVGLDRSDAQLQLATARGVARYGRADVTALPIAGAAVDAVVACLVLEHVEACDDMIREAARVLRAGGIFLLLLNHPLLQAPGSGWIDDRILDEQYWRIGPYLDEEHTMEEVAPGVLLPFIHRPLHRYINVMASCGLFVEFMDEPVPPEGFLARAPEYREAATIPRLLVLRARKTNP